MYFMNHLRFLLLKPMTGYFRDGSCRTDNEDIETHTVCAVMTEDFWVFCSNG